MFNALEPGGLFIPVNQALDDGQPKPGTAEFPGLAATDLEERLIDMLEPVSRDPNSGILHVEDLPELEGFDLFFATAGFEPLP